MILLSQFIFIPLLSLLPCVLWLWYFSSRSRYKRPAFTVVGLPFLLGALSTVPALALNLIGQDFFLNLFGGTQLSHLMVLLFVVGPVEEGMKLLVVYFYTYRRPEF